MRRTAYVLSAWTLLLAACGPAAAPGPTAIESVTLFVFASTRVSMFFAGVVTQMPRNLVTTAKAPSHS